MMAGVQSCRRDRTTRHEEIVAYVRRFGPVTTSQIRDKFRYRTTRGLNSTLHHFPELICETDRHGKASIWRAAK